MRQFKTFWTPIISFLIIISILVYLYQTNVSAQLNQQHKKVNELWDKFKFDLSIRDSLLTKLTTDSINYWIRNSIAERNKEENNLNFTYYEYKINELVMAHFQNKKQILEFNIRLNNDLSKYNAMVVQYDRNISIFPNFIIAKENGYYREKHFEIVYGNENKNPIETSKELPEWAKGIDTD